MYCQKVCGEVGFSIDEWNEAFKYCNDAGIEGIERDKILSPEKFPCTKQCFACMAIVGERRLKTKQLNHNGSGKTVKNMKAIVLAFTLKGQEFHKISDALQTVKEKVGEDTVVIHGFMPRLEIEKRGFSTEVVDMLETTFPIRLNVYNGKPLRSEMAELASKLEAKVYVVGEVKEGVLEEVNFYKEQGLEIVEIPL